MRENFPRCMAHVFDSEGGYVDHPNDPGGATNLGVTRSTLSKWRGRAVSKTDVRNLTRSEAQGIYRAGYWNRVRGDALPAGLDLVAFDAAVNSGPRRGAQWLQAALGVTADGIIGPVTIVAAMKADKSKVINAACDARLHFLRRLRTWPTFGRGWQARVDRVRAEALDMASESAPRNRFSLSMFLRLLFGGRK